MRPMRPMLLSALVAGAAVSGALAQGGGGGGSSAFEQFRQKLGTGSLFDFAQEMLKTVNYRAELDRVYKTPGDIEARLKEWSPPEPHYRRGVLARYAYLVGSASEGAMLKP